MKPVVTFANWGNYNIAFKLFLEGLGLEVILPEKTNPRTISEGAKLSPEMFCLPFKVNLGNYLSAIKKGANVIFMVTASQGSCRLRYYGITQEKILKEMGEEIKFIVFDQGLIDIYRKIKNISGCSFFDIFRSAILCLETIFFIEKIEKISAFLRPREKEKGKTDEIFVNSLKKLSEAKSFQMLSKTKKEILKSFASIKYEKTKKVPRVGLIGEIYTTCEPAVNFELERKLGKEGVEVHRQMTLSYHLLKKFFFTDWRIQRKIKKYLASTVGGHGRDAIYEMLKYKKENFDGVIQTLPAMCMPESTVRPILEKIHQESGIPFLSLSFDEQVAEAGIDTRIEAFVDVVKNYYARKTA